MHICGAINCNAFSLIFLQCLLAFCLHVVAVDICDVNINTNESNRALNYVLIIPLIEDLIIAYFVCKSAIICPTFIK